MQGVKLTKESVAYKPAINGERCGTCTMLEGNGCAKVHGWISRSMVCRLWEKKNGG